MAKIITFYSYKGGVGRTFVLANVAALLARRGHKVLCVDWDMEAPGLDAYFPSPQEKKKRKAASKSKPGLVDLCMSASTAAPLSWREAVRNTNHKNLEIIPSSDESDDYGKKVQRIDWRQLYKGGLDETLESWKKEWREVYDFILIDSRTGLGDIAGICTIHLPELIVFTFTANHQSLHGGIQTIGRALEARRHYVHNRGLPFVLPLLTRLEQTVEVDLSREWLAKIADAITPLMEPWRPAGIEPAAFLEKVKIPHVARWTFGEELPVLTETGDDPQTISHYLAKVANLIRGNLHNVAEVIASNGMVLAQERVPRVFISYAWEDEDFKKQIGDFADRLRKEGGIDAWIDQYDEIDENTWRDWRDLQVKRSDRVIWVSSFDARLFLKGASPAKFTGIPSAIEFF